jgi:hypothetical protein
MWLAMRIQTKTFFTKSLPDSPCAYISTHKHQHLSHQINTWLTMRIQINKWVTKSARDSLHAYKSTRDSPSQYVTCYAQANQHHTRKSQHVTCRAHTRHYVTHDSHANQHGNGNIAFFNLVKTAAKKTQTCVPKRRREGSLFTSQSGDKNIKCRTDISDTHENCSCFFLFVLHKCLHRTFNSGRGCVRSGCSGLLCLPRTHALLRKQCQVT